MQQVFIPLLFLTILKLCLADGIISFDTRLVEVKEVGFNEAVLNVLRNGTTDVSFTCTVCIFKIITFLKFI